MRSIYANLKMNDFFGRNVINSPENNTTMEKNSPLIKEQETIDENLQPVPKRIKND